MTTKKKGAPTTDNAPKITQENIKPKPPTKQEVALLTLLEAGKHGLNTFEANDKYGDTCLHSTISAFRKFYSIDFSTNQECVISRVGTPVSVKRYFLLDELSIKASKKLIDYWRQKRNAPPLFKPKSE